MPKPVTHREVVLTRPDKASPHPDLDNYTSEELLEGLPEDVKEKLRPGRQAAKMRAHFLFTGQDPHYHRDFITPYYSQKKARAERKPRSAKKYMRAVHKARLSLEKEIRRSAMEQDEFLPPRFATFLSHLLMALLHKSE